MIENKSLRSKIFDILNIVILIAITVNLYCAGMVRSLRVIEQQGSSQCGKSCTSGRLASTCSPIKKSWERPHFSVRFWYLLREFCWEPESVWYVSLWQHIHYPEQKNSSRKEISLCGYSCSACYLTEERFRGISP